MFRFSFVLPVTRDGRALLKREKHGDDVPKLALLGGKAIAGEDSFQCAAREANEESGGALSKVTILRISRGAGVKCQADFHAPYQEPVTKSVAVVHDLVVPEDTDVDMRFDKQEAVRLKAASKKAGAHPTIGKKKKPMKKCRVYAEQLDIVFVPLANLRSQEWREKSMHPFPHSVLVARLMKEYIHSTPDNPASVV